MKAKGSWPFRASGMPTTQASATRGWLVMACSMLPVQEDGLSVWFLLEAAEKGVWREPTAG